MVSPIQCLLCVTYRIPSLRFCYRCFHNVAVNFIIRATSAGGSHWYRCQMCFIKMKTKAAMYQHCSQNHIPKEYVDFRYPFKVKEIAIITSGDEDCYNKDVDPRNSSLRLGILIPETSNRQMVTPHPAWIGMPQPARPGPPQPDTPCHSLPQ